MVMTYNAEKGGILVNNKEYHRRYYSGRAVDAHVWYLNTGSYPSGSIRYQDGDPLNKRFENLIDYVYRGAKPRARSVWDYSAVERLKVLVEQGLSNKEIADQLCKSPASINSQVYKRGLRKKVPSDQNSKFT